MVGRHMQHQWDSVIFLIRGNPAVYPSSSTLFKEFKPPQASSGCSIRGGGRTDAVQNSRDAEDQEKK